MPASAASVFLSEASTAERSGYHDDYGLELHRRPPGSPKGSNGQGSSSSGSGQGDCETGGSSSGELGGFCIGRFPLTTISSGWMAWSCRRDSARTAVSRYVRQSRPRTSASWAAQPAALPRRRLYGRTSSRRRRAERLVVVRTEESATAGEMPWASGPLAGGTARSIHAASALGLGTAVRKASQLAPPAIRSQGNLTYPPSQE